MHAEEVSQADGVAETGATYSQNVTYKGLSARHLASNATRTAFIYAVPDLASTSSTAAGLLPASDIPQSP